MFYSDSDAYTDSHTDADTDADAIQIHTDTHGSNWKCAYAHTQAFVLRETTHNC